MNIIEYPSFNFSDRTTDKIDKILFHYTVVDKKTALEMLVEKKYAVSAHYLIDEDGTIYRLVDEQKKAWHAGVSHWNGHDNINDSSIGIEIVNDAASPFTNAQVDAIKLLCEDINTRCDINLYLGHSDVAMPYGRKVDPGQFFPWQELANDNIGFWHNIDANNPTVKFAVGDSSQDIYDLKTNLTKIGYKVNLDDCFDKDLSDLCKVFHLHYMPSIVDTNIDLTNQDSFIYAETIAIAEALCKSIDNTNDYLV